MTELLFEQHFLVSVFERCLLSVCSIRITQCPVIRRLLREGCHSERPLQSELETTNPMSVDEKRIQARFELDLLPDYTVVGKTVSFRREFRTLTADETFCAVPDVVVARAKTLLTCPLIDTVARTVHDRVFFELGCSRVPLFALLVGGRNRTMFSFPCVFDRCSAFLDVRLFSGGLHSEVGADEPLPQPRVCNVPTTDAEGDVLICNSGTFRGGGGA